MPLPSTLTPIATNTLTANAASVTFSNLPQGYTDLVVILSAFGSIAGADIRLQVNSDTGTNYSSTRLIGYTSAVSNRNSNATYFQPTNYVGIGSSEATASVFNLMNYSNTNVYKTMLVRHNQPQGAYFETAAHVGLWRSTSAITTIQFSLSSGNYSANSTFTIYGVKAA